MSKKKKIDNSSKAMTLRWKAFNALVGALWDLMRETDMAPYGDREALMIIDEYINWSKEHGDKPTKKSVKHLEERAYKLSAEGVMLWQLQAQLTESEGEKTKPETGLEIAKRILG